MLHLMQDLLHWAHKLARNGLVELGCVYNFEYMEKLLELLRATRLKNGISQEYLSLKLGVSSSSVSRWESKGNFPSVDKLFEYAELLGFTLQEVLALSANAPVEVPNQLVRLRSQPYFGGMMKFVSSTLMARPSIGVKKLSPNPESHIVLFLRHSFLVGYLRGCSAHQEPRARPHSSALG